MTKRHWGGATLIRELAGRVMSDDARGLPAGFRLWVRALWLGDGELVAYGGGREKIKLRQRLAMAV